MSANRSICNHPKPLTYLNLLVNVKSSNYPCIMNTILLFAALLFGTFLQGADATAVSYTGNVTMDSPKWNRPNPDMCPSFPRGNNLFVGYSVQSFNVLTTGLFDVMIKVDSEHDFGGIIFVYEDVFDPMVPLQNLLDCSDSDDSFVSASVTVDLQCGTQYFVVMSAFESAPVGFPEFGTFTNTISCPACVQPVLGLLDDRDADGDGVTDVCDPDVDGDGIDNVIDNCPMDANASQEDLDRDGDGDVCDPDVDGDDIDNVMDNCPMDANASQEDLDRDGDGDVCDPDVDGDGIDNVMDNCPMDANASQEDLDRDGDGDVCDPDVDGDGIDNVMDNCPMDANANQEDLDRDGDGDVCDPDVDGDGIDNVMDNCPLTPLTERPVTLKGCSINQLCPCKGSWSKHELYIACITRITTRFKNVGVITGIEKREIQNKAARSTCGKHMHEKLRKRYH